jgi:cytochrome c oxidase subunit 3
MVDRAEARQPRADEPYVDAGQQHAAGMMGIYVFLATELMLFGGLFAVAFAIRILHAEDYIAASKRLHVWIGFSNTVVLLTSSLAVALAVQAGRAGQARRAASWLAAAAALGLAFLAIKGVEYRIEYGEGLLPAVSDPTHFATPVQHRFMDLYLIATGLHAVHLLIGILLLAGVAIRLAGRTLPLPRRIIVVEVAGIYWHFVDVVWVFLYPALYLAR